jgi:hypothetical protein
LIATTGPHTRSPSEAQGSSRVPLGSRPARDSAQSVGMRVSRRYLDLGFLAFALPQMEILMPTKKPRGEELTLEQQRANQALYQRRLRIEPVNRSVKRCRIVKDRIRLWKAGIRDLVMAICCAPHPFRVRLTPWRAMV